MRALVYGVTVHDDDLVSHRGHVRLQGLTLLWQADASPAECGKSI